MRKIVFFAHADCVGTDHQELVCFEGEVSNPFLDDYAEEFGYNWTSSWEPDCGGEDDDYEDPDQYYEQCGWWWEEYDPTKHNGVIDSDSEGF